MNHSFVAKLSCICNTNKVQMVEKIYNLETNAKQILALLFFGVEMLLPDVAEDLQHLTGLERASRDAALSRSVQLPGRLYFLALDACLESLAHLVAVPGRVGGVGHAHPQRHAEEGVDGLEAAVARGGAVGGDGAGAAGQQHPGVGAVVAGRDRTGLAVQAEAISLLGWGSFFLGRTLLLWAVFFGRWLLLARAWAFGLLLVNVLVRMRPLLPGLVLTLAAFVDESREVGPAVRARVGPDVVDRRQQLLLGDTLRHQEGLLEVDVVWVEPVQRGGVLA